MQNDYQFMAGNKCLRAADGAKNDEFYTQLADIENELRHYKHHFRGKTVFCNCDDPYESNFFKFFASDFNELGLKKLIATCYNGSPVAGNELPFDFVDDTDGACPVLANNRIAHKIIITEIPDLNNDGAVNMADVDLLIQSDKNVLTQLHGDETYGAGDFRSKECIELLKEADIVVTNPPFSLFREYVAQLIKYEKKFLILGNMNAITYKEIFSLIKENKLWAGYGFNMSMVYKTTYENNLDANRKFVKQKGYNPDENFIKVPAINWYTNLDHKKRHEELDLYKKYSPEKYPKFDNYNAINVNFIVDIPYDYNGLMGVPITFLNKFNPEQFEIIEGLNRYTILDVEKKNDWAKRNHIHFTTINGKPKYFRILIRKK